MIASQLLASVAFLFHLVYCFAFTTQSFPIRSYYRASNGQEWNNIKFALHPCWMVPKLIVETQEDILQLPLNISSKQIRYLSSDIRFGYRIRQLQDFYRQHGHFSVREKHDKGLAQWVSTQQYEYKRLMQGQESLLTLARVEQLNNIGFEWVRTDGLSKDWMERYQELKEFLEAHGHIRLGGRDGSLGKWVANQRHQYQCFRKGKKSLMTKARVDLLNEINMIWDRKATKTTRHDENWEARLRDLQQFKEQHGHCNVPRTLGPLGVWVSNQRVSYIQRIQNKTSKLTDYREQKLQALGFQFCPPSLEDIWNQRYQELKAFQLENGHCRVPTGALATWVSTQRQAHQRAKKKKLNGLLPERQRRLQAIGFFDRDNFSQSWDDRFCELHAFQEEHGHCRVPASPLGQWVARQRDAYRKRSDTFAGLSRWRENRLRAIGFDFSLVVNSKRQSRDKRMAEKWMAKYLELKDFRENHGHIRLGAKDGPLGKWVASERRQYQRYLQQQNTTLTAARVNMLNEINMIWDQQVTKDRKK